VIYKIFVKLLLAQKV